MARAGAGAGRPALRAGGALGAELRSMQLVCLKRMAAAVDGCRVHPPCVFLHPAIEFAVPPCSVGPQTPPRHCFTPLLGLTSTPHYATGPPPAGSIPLRPELAALRQRLYKLDNKVKHDFKRDAGEEQFGD